MAVLLSLITALIPLIIAPGVMFYFDVTPKIVVLLAGVAIALPWALGSDRLSVPRPFAILLAAFFCSLVVSTLLAPDRALSFTGTNWRRLGLVSWTAILLYTAVLTAFCSHASRILLILRVTSVAALVAGLYGISQFFGWDPLLPSAQYHIGEGQWTIVRPPGSLGYVTYFANFLVAGLFAAAALVMADSQPRWRALGAVIAAVCCLAIVLSGTRAAILGVLAGALVLLLWIRPRNVFRRAVAGAALAASLLAAFYISPAGEKLRARTRWYMEDPTGGPRLWLWRDSAAMGLHAPAAGVGPENFTWLFPRHQSAELARLYPDFYYESPHNLFLDALTAQGIPGLMFLLALIVWAFIAARRADSRVAAPLAAGLAGSVVAHQFACFTVPTALAFFATLGLIASLNRTSPAPARPRLMAAAVALPVSALLVFFATRLLFADLGLASTRRHLEVGDTRSAIQAYSAATGWAPPGMSADLWFSRRLAQSALQSSDASTRMQAAQQALLSGTRSAALSEERHNSWYSLATLTASLGDASGTERSLRSAIAAAPNWYKPHWSLARLLAASGRLAEAAEEAERAVSLSGGKIAEVVQTRSLIQLQVGVNRRKEGAEN